MNSTILRALSERGFKTVDSEFYQKIEEWREWYESNVGSFHSYRVFNGQEMLNVHRYSIGMAKKGCEDWANLLMNEKVKITLEGSAEQEFVDKTLKANNFSVKISEMQELKSALGTTAYIPRATGVEITRATGNVLGNASGITIDYVTADNIAPLSWENGVITECAFAADRKIEDKKYVYLQIHRIGNDGNYDIENILYQNIEDSLLEVPLRSVKGFENVSPIIHTKSPIRQFVIDRLNIVNNMDTTSPMGISVYANCIDSLKGCDIAYDAYVNEFILGKKRIMVKPEAVKDLNGNPVFDPTDTCFYVMAEDSQSGSSIHEINMELRASQFNQGLQDMLNVLSAKMGFGENHYQFDRGSIQTATQIISENSTLFRSIKKHEIVLENVLVELCRILLRMGKAYMGENLDENVKIKIDFDDSIIEDRATEFARDIQKLQTGVISRKEFREKWNNESPEKAEEAIKALDAETEEQQTKQIEAQQQATAQQQAYEQQKQQAQYQFELEKLRLQQEFELEKLRIQNANRKQ